MKRHENCLDELELLEYLDGSLSPKNQALMMEHIGRCADCSRKMAIIVRTTKSRATPEEARELDRLMQAADLEPVADLVGELASPNEEAAPRSIDWRATWDRVAGAARGLVPAPRYAVVPVAVAALVFALIPPYKTYQSNILADRAIRTATQSYKLSIDQTRPSGGFQFSVLGTQRSFSDDSLRFAAFGAAKQALDKRQENPKAQAAQATLLYLEHDQEAARLLLEQAVAADPTNARYLNDLGLVMAAQGDTTGAIQQLRRAVSSDREYQEASYNLALLLQESGHREDATTAWRVYLKADSTSNWANVARIHLQELMAPE